MSAKTYWQNWMRYLAKHDLTPFYSDPISLYDKIITDSEREKWKFYNYKKTHEMDLLGLRCINCKKRLTEIHAKRLICDYVKEIQQ